MMIIRIVIKNRKTGELVEIFETTMAKRTREGKFTASNQEVFERMLANLHPAFGNFITIECIS